MDTLTYVFPFRTTDCQVVYSLFPNWTRVAYNYIHGYEYNYNYQIWTKSMAALSMYGNYYTIIKFVVPTAPQKVAMISQFQQRTQK